MITVAMRKQRTLSSYVHLGKQLDSKFLLVPESVEVLEVEVPIVEVIKNKRHIILSFTPVLPPS